MHLDLAKINKLGESSPNFKFTAVNLCLIVLKKSELRVNLNKKNKEKVNGGEGLRKMSSRF